MLKNKISHENEISNPGISFEKAVALVQKMMDSKSVVEHNQRITDKYGHSRQFDVVIRGKLGGHEILGIIECKDLKGKVGPAGIF